MTDPSATKTRTRRAEPIDKRTAKNGTVTYTFQVDVGTKPDGTRDRDRFTYRTLKEARREYRRITIEVAEGRYKKTTSLTVDQAIDAWLAGKHGVRRITLENYTQDLKPVRRRLGGKKLADVTKADGDALVKWMLTQGRTDPRHRREGSLMSQVVEFLSRRPEGVSAATIRAQFPDKHVHSCLSGLVRDGRAMRPRRGVYCIADPAQVAPTATGVKPVTVRTTLTTFGMVVQSYADEGLLPRNVIALVERPGDEVPENDDETSKSWSLAEMETFRASVRAERLYACWLLSSYGMRRSEILGLRWTRIENDTLLVRRGRVAIGKDSEENLPKSRRSRRDLPLPADVAAALRRLKTVQKAECLALGESWSDDRLIAVDEDGSPVRPERYSDEFQRLRERAGLRRITLKGLRNTSVSLMLARRIPVHVVAAWHGHDPAVSLSIYSDAQPDDLRAAGAAVFG
ncbi:site-specific integrase [Nocardia terpenica]|nr:site-specific integrase [Nocardia terpenica]